jgi:Secretion system C-terminal sorting domain
MKNFFFTIVITCIATFQLLAQTNATMFDWAFNTGGGYNKLNRMHYDSKGNLLFLALIGDSTKFGTVIGGTPYPGYPGTARFIGKYTQAGVKSIVLHGPLDYTTTTTFNDFVLDANDNIIVSGSMFNTATPYDFGNGITLTGKGFFVAKFNSSGVAQWAKLYDMGITNSSSTSPVALGVLPNNDIYFAARNSNGTAPFWLARINTNGTEVWHKEWIFTGVPAIKSSANNLFIDNAGTAYFYVQSTSPFITVNADTVFAPAGAHPATAYLLSIDGNGNNKLLTGYRGGIGDIALDKATGNLFVHWAQYLVNPAPFNTINYNAANQYQGVVVVDSNRNYLKSTASAASFLLGGDIESIFPLGGYSFMGSQDLQPTVTITAGAQTFTATKESYAYKFYDSNMVFSKFVAHPESNGASSTTSPLIARFDNKLAVAGEYLLVNNPTITINGTVLTSCEHNLNFGTKYPSWAALASDLFIAQLTIGASTLPNAIANNIQLNNDFTVFPNPSKGSFYMRFSENNINGTAQIIDMTGKVVHSSSIKNNLQYCVTNLASGLYFVKCINANSQVTQKKIVVE